MFLFCTVLLSFAFSARYNVCMGIVFAVIALVCWAVGDFLIQRSARKFGDVISLFFITLLGTIILFPFVYGQFHLLSAGGTVFWSLFIISAFTLCAALLEFEALRTGKLSVIEPMFALELPVTILLAGFIIHEVPSLPQAVYLVTLLIGIMMVSLKSFRIHVSFEKGVFLAIVATSTMALINLLFGAAGRVTSPLLVNWFTSAWITIVLFVYLWKKHGLRRVVYNAEHFKNLIFSVGFLDNLAWVAFVYSMTYLPIAVATGITESYIAISALLGIVINKEVLLGHQKLGLAFTIVSAILLAVVT